jgi:hypothetical protein
MHTRTWTVKIYLSEEDAVTKAHAVLVTDNPTAVQLHGEGTALVHPSEQSVPEIGDEIASARALADLAGALQNTARVDLEGVLGAPSRQ